MIKLLSALYFMGALFFATALVLIILRIFDVPAPSPAWPLIGGFVLMMSSKFAAAAAIRKAEKR